MINSNPLFDAVLRIMDGHTVAPLGDAHSNISNSARGYSYSYRCQLCRDNIDHTMQQHNSITGRL